MTLDKIIFYRDLSKESTNIKKLLKKNKIEYRAIFSEECDRGPLLLVPNNTYSIRGYKRVLSEIRNLKKNYQKKN